MKNKKKINLYSKAKSFIKRLSFASHKKGFLKSNKHIEILYLEGEEPVKKKINKKPVFYTSLSLGMVAILLLVFSFSIGVEGMKSGYRSFLAGMGIYTSEVKTVEIQSNDYNNPGSWHIDKSGEWIENGKARVTFDLKTISKKSDSNYKDIILVIDNSGSMLGEKMNKVIEDSKELVNTILSDNHNKMALIEFNTDSTILSPLTNSKTTLLDQLDSITVTGTTNYNAALEKVDEVMNNYQQQSNRDAIVLFLTDGEPNKDTPSQVATYHILKDRYPYMTINGIQYEMGRVIIKEIREISDFQWIADKEALHNVLFEAAIPSYYYEELIITDYIADDFKVNSVNDIKVDYGTVSLEVESGRQKIIWNLGTNEFYTGMNAKMTIDLSLKTGTFSEMGFVPTNEKETIVSKLPNESEKTLNSTNTPVLKNNYTIYYSANAPTGCNIESNTSENHYVFEEVAKRTSTLTCSGYLFQGWEIDAEDNKDITYINSDTFIMPVHDVHVRATWTKQGINKSMDGEVHQKTTLYKVFEQEASAGSYVLEYTGEHKDSFTTPATKKIYYYHPTDERENYDVLSRNNVILGGYCWQMYRTTDTGGVRLLFNGTAENNQCLEDRANTVGYVSFSTKSMGSGLNYYGTDYTYDSSTRNYTLAGDITTSYWNESSFSDLYGKYTCVSTTLDPCSELYQIRDFYSSSSAGVMKVGLVYLNGDMGTYLPFNNYSNSLAYVGYMYGNVYPMENYGDEKTIIATNYANAMKTNTLSTDMWFADDCIKNDQTSQWELVNPYQVSSSQFSSLVGKYTFFNTNQNYTSSLEPNLISYVTSSTAYYPYFDKNTIKIATSIIDNGNDTYTLVNPITIKHSDYITNCEDYSHVYSCGNMNDTCSGSSMRYRYTIINSRPYIYSTIINNQILIAKSQNGTQLINTLLLPKHELLMHPENYTDYIYTCNSTSDTCPEEEMKYIADVKDYYLKLVPSYYYASSVSWNGTSYTLQNVITPSNYSNSEVLSTHHYTCEKPNLTTCEKVKYIFNVEDNANDLRTLRYITLSNGETIEDALENMLQKNLSDSVAKMAIDSWYKKYLFDYSDYLEETIFCNDRTIQDIAGWEVNGDISNTLKFKGNEPYTDLKCYNVTDQLSIDNNQAKLKYSVGLMSLPELQLMSRHGKLNTNGSWLLTPTDFGNDSPSYGAKMNYAKYGATNYPSPHRFFDSWFRKHVSYSTQTTVNPVISLIPEIEYSSGDGSFEYPYIIETD